MEVGVPSTLLLINNYDCYVYVCVCVAYLYVDALRGQKKTSDLQLELEVGMNSSIWVLGIKLWSPARVEHALNCQVISPAPHRPS